MTDAYYNTLSAQSLTTRSRHGSHCTADDVVAKLQVLDMKLVEACLTKEKKPFVVCKYLPETEWHKFVDNYSEEDNSIKVRQLDYVDGLVLIIEMLSYEHELTVGAFNALFVKALGDFDLAYIGSATTHHMQPDCSFGPIQPTLPLPTGLNHKMEWATLIVEVAYSQRANSVNRKLAQWANVPGVKYLLAIFVTEKLRSFRFELYYIEDGWIPTTPNSLPTLLVECPEVIVDDDHSPKTITMNAHVLFGLRSTDELPDGVNNPVILDINRVIHVAKMKYRD